VPGAVLALAAALWLASCAGPAPPHPPAPGPEQVWARFTAGDRDAPQGPIALKASIFYFTGGEAARGYRLVLDIWGGTDHPLRLDAVAGFGRRVAHLLETDQGWLAYIPDTQVLYHSPAAPSSPGAAGILRLLDIEASLTLQDVVLAMLGRARHLAGENSTFQAMDPDGNFVYALSPDRGRRRRLTLSPRGEPLAMSGEKPLPWRLAWETAQGVDAIRRLDLRLAGGGHAVITVKEIENRDRPWPETSLELPVPPGTRIVEFR
jgi:hypothetical protein